MDDLDEAIALVYEQEPSSFVTARNALVKGLKAGKRKGDAARVAALRKPSKLAWAVGQAARAEPAAARAYDDAVAALSAPGADIRESSTHLREAVGRLAAGATGVDRGEVEAALLAIAADPEAMEALRLGRLADVPAGGGFGSLTLVGPSRAHGDERDGDADDGDGGGEDAEIDATREEEERAALEAAAAARRHELEEKLEAAEKNETLARERVEEAERALERARQVLDDARRAVADASAALDGD